MAETSRPESPSLRWCMAYARISVPSHATRPTKTTAASRMPSSRAGRSTAGPAWAGSRSACIRTSRAAVDAGTQLIVATPHIRADFNVDPVEIEPRVDLFNERLQRERLPLRVLPGAEIGWATAPELDDTQLARLSLGSGKRILLESPYGKKAVDVEGIIAGLEARGFQAVLAHPERCPLFQRDPERLRKLVAEGALCSITAGSMLGRLGGTVRTFTIEMLRDGLVHDVASDAHDHLHRPPGLVDGFE